MNDMDVDSPEGPIFLPIYCKYAPGTMAQLASLNEHGLNVASAALAEESNLSGALSSASGGGARKRRRSSMLSDMVSAQEQSASSSSQSTSNPTASTMTNPGSTETMSSLTTPTPWLMGRKFASPRVATRHALAPRNKISFVEIEDVNMDDDTDSDGEGEGLDYYDNDSDDDSDDDSEDEEEKNGHRRKRLRSTVRGYFHGHKSRIATKIDSFKLGQSFFQAPATVGLPETPTDNIEDLEERLEKAFPSFDSELQQQPSTPKLVAQPVTYPDMIVPVKSEISIDPESHMAVFNDVRSRRAFSLIRSHGPTPFANKNKKKTRSGGIQKVPSAKGLLRQKDKRNKLPGQADLIFSRWSLNSATESAKLSTASSQPSVGYSPNLPPFTDSGPKPVLRSKINSNIEEEEKRLQEYAKAEAQRKRRLRELGFTSDAEEEEQANIRHRRLRKQFPGKSREEISGLFKLMREEQVAAYKREL